LAAKSGQKLTNMQLQKLVFLAHGVSLASLECPLTFHNIHAWQWGPVLPQLYKRFSKYGSNCVESPAECEEVVPENAEENEVITLVWKKFGHLTGPQLSSLTHQTGSPWDITWNSDQYGVIPNELIQNYYREQFHVGRETESA
jgi:uncharacterized phage-associated protein